MIIVNGTLYLPYAWYIILSLNQFFIIKILHYWFLAKNIGNYIKYDIFLNFGFTEKMIFPQIVGNQRNMIFTLSAFTKMLFFMQCEIKPVLTLNKTIYVEFIVLELSKSLMYDFSYNKFWCWIVFYWHR